MNTNQEVIIQVEGLRVLAEALRSQKLQIIQLEGIVQDLRMKALKESQSNLVKGGNNIKWIEKMQ